MKLADKQVYPCSIPQSFDSAWDGITFRERLIIALASNPVFFRLTESYDGQEEELSCASVIINQADAIIKEMEK